MNTLECKYTWVYRDVLSAFVVHVCESICVDRSRFNSSLQPLHDRLEPHRLRCLTSGTGTSAAVHLKEEITTPMVSLHDGQ
jgi:hypothetical protein